MAADVTLRPALGADTDLVCAVTERTMRGYVEQTWGRFDPAVVRDNAERMIATGTYAILVKGGADIGVLHVERDAGDIWLAQLFILPEHQGHGIGTRFLRELKQEAAAARKPLRLRVLTVNPAKALYEREGFTAFTTTQGRIYMQWAPPGLQVPTSSGECPPQVRSVLDSCGIAPDLVAERYLVVQPETQELEVIGRDASGREHRLSPAAAQAWRTMQGAAEGQGVRLLPVSAFRSIERQAEIIRSKLDRGAAIEDIIKVSAPPGYSEHHTGMAIDIGAENAPPLDEAFEQTPAFAWLRENAGRFGFRLSYPPANPYNYRYEPWHWCFTLGVDEP